MKELLLQHLSRFLNMDEVRFTRELMFKERIPLYRANPDLNELINELVIDFSIEQDDVSLYETFDNYERIICEL